MNRSSSLSHKSTTLLAYVVTATKASGDSVEEVEFRITDSRYPLVSIPEQTGCETRIEQIVPRDDGTYAVFHCFTGASPERVAEQTNEYASLDARIIDRHDEGGVLEVRVSKPEDHFVVTLTGAGALPREIRSADGVASIVAEVPSMYCTSEVVDRFLEAHPSAEVVARRQKDHTVPIFTRREFGRAIENQLTPRQSEVLRAAYAEGYYDWPREKSGAEVAAKLGVSSPTFSQHLRIAERKVFALLFDEWQTHGSLA